MALFFQCAYLSWYFKNAIFSKFLYHFSSKNLINSLLLSQIEDGYVNIDENFF